MEPLIYYPTFEPPSEIWLKFSLLYFEDFRPIVPYNRIDSLSPEFRMVQEKTDLITICSPRFDDGERASIKAIDEVDTMLKRPEKGERLFKQNLFLEKWRDERTWKSKLYVEKFSQDWANYCIENQIGQKIDDGLLLSEELCFLFMTYLAKELAFRESAAIITDNNKFDNFTNYARATNHTLDRRTKFAKNICSLLVPQNLNDIPIKKIIKFRKKNRALISAFNSELDNVQEKIGKGYSGKEFIENYNKIYSESLPSDKTLKMSK